MAPPAPPAGNHGLDAGHVGCGDRFDIGGRIDSVSIQLGQPQATADGDALCVDDRVEFVAVDAGEDAGDGQGRAGDAGLQGAAGGGAGVVGHLRENGPQLGQFACQVGGGAGQAQAGNGRQQVGFAGGERGKQRAVGRKFGRIQHRTELRQQLQAWGRRLPSGAGADADFEYQVGPLEADPAPEVVGLRIGVVVAVSRRRVGGAGVAAGAVFGRRAQGEAVRIAAGYGAEGDAVGQAGRGAIRIQRGQRGVGVFLRAGQTADEDEMEAFAGGRLGCAVQERRDLPFGAGYAAGVELPETGRMCNQGFDLFVECHLTPVASG